MSFRPARFPSRLYAAAILVACAVLAASFPAQAAWPELPLSPLTWGLLAAAGLVAVAIAALTVRRGGHDDEEVRTPDVVATPAAPGVTPPSRHYIGELPVAGVEPVAVTPQTIVPPAAVRTRGAGLIAQTGPASVMPVAAREPEAAAPGTPPLVASGPATEDEMRGAAATILATPSALEAANAADLEPEVAPVATQAARNDGAPPFLALHHVDLSIDVLRSHLAAADRPMPAVWLMLLDLCRTHGREAAFREVAAQFHARFNVQAPTWSSYPPTRDEPGLEAYPRLIRELTQTWGTHECKRLLDRLLYDNRSGQRRGFTLNAYNDLIALRRAADVVRETIEQDLAEESKVRAAYAQAAANGDVPEVPADLPFTPSPLVRDLESTLDDDLLDDRDGRSALEREHPAFAATLAREWGNAALAGRLCEMLARGGDGAEPLSGEARDEVELLRRMARRLSEVNRFTLAAD